MTTTDRYVTHDTLVLERRYRATPQRVFAAWADPGAKQVWFLGSEPDEFTPAEYELDFRVGGREFTRGGPEGGEVFTYEARYDDIVDDRRIVYTYVMHRGDVAHLGVGHLGRVPAGRATAPRSSSPSTASTSTARTSPRTAPRASPPSSPRWAPGWTGRDRPRAGARRCTCCAAGC